MCLRRRSRPSAAAGTYPLACSRTSERRGAAGAIVPAVLGSLACAAALPGQAPALLIISHPEPSISSLSPTLTLYLLLYTNNCDRTLSPHAIMPALPMVEGQGLASGCHRRCSMPQQTRTPGAGTLPVRALPRAVIGGSSTGPVLDQIASGVSQGSPRRGTLRHLRRPSTALSELLISSEAMSDPVRAGCSVAFVIASGPSAALASRGLLMSPLCLQETMAGDRYQQGGLAHLWLS